MHHCYAAIIPLRPDPRAGGTPAVTGPDGTGYETGLSAEHAAVLRNSWPATSQLPGAPSARGRIPPT
jgi:hypothetical protein